MTPLAGLLLLLLTAGVRDFLVLMMSRSIEEDICICKRRWVWYRVECLCHMSRFMSSIREVDSRCLCHPLSAYAAFHSIPSTRVQSIGCKLKSMAVAKRYIYLFSSHLIRRRKSS